MGTAGEIIVLTKFSPKRERMLGTINENTKLLNDDDNGLKRSVTCWRVCANAFNKVNSLDSYLRTYFRIFWVIYFSFFLTFHFGFGNNSFLQVASTSNMYWNLRVKLYVTEIQLIYFSVLYNTLFTIFRYCRTTNNRWKSRMGFSRRTWKQKYDQELSVAVPR